MTTLLNFIVFGLIGFLVFRIYFSKIALPLFGIPGTITDKQRKLLKELGQNKTKDLSKEQGTALISTCLFLNEAYSKLGINEEEIKRTQFQKNLAFLLKNNKFKDFLVDNSKSLKGGDVEQWLNNNSKDIRDFIVNQFKLKPLSLDIPSPTNKTQAKKSFREYLQSIQLNKEDIRDEIESFSDDMTDGEQALKEDIEDTKNEIVELKTKIKNFKRKEDEDGFTLEDLKKDLESEQRNLEELKNELKETKGDWSKFLKDYIANHETFRRRFYIP